MSRLEWTNATSVAEAVAQMEAGAVAKAGGIDVLDLLKEGLMEPARLVNLRTVRGMDRVEDGGPEGLRIGALVTLARLAEDPLVRRHARALADAAGHAATPQIRAAATLGGNLLQRPRCWYFRSLDFKCLRKAGTQCYALQGDNRYHAIFDNGKCAIVHPSATATALVALGAKILVTGPKGPREVALESIFVSPEVNVMLENNLHHGDVVTEVRIPPLARGAVSAYAKLGEKESFDWPIAEVACVIERSEGRCARASVVLGAAAPIPWRAKAAEAALAGQPLDEATARAAAKAALSGATPLSGNAYKLPIFEVVVRRTIMAAMKGEEAR